MLVNGKRKPTKQIVNKLDSLGVTFNQGVEGSNPSRLTSFEKFQNPDGGQHFFNESECLNTRFYRHPDFIFFKTRKSIRVENVALRIMS